MERDRSAHAPMKDIVSTFINVLRALEVAVLNTVVDDDGTGLYVILQGEGFLGQINSMRINLPEGAAYKSSSVPIASLGELPPFPVCLAALSSRSFLSSYCHRQPEPRVLTTLRLPVETLGLAVSYATMHKAGDFKLCWGCPDNAAFSVQYCDEEGFVFVENLEVDVLFLAKAYDRVQHSRMPLQKLTAILKHLEEIAATDLYLYVLEAGNLIIKASSPSVKEVIMYLE